MRVLPLIVGTVSVLTFSAGCAGPALSLPPNNALEVDFTAEDGNHRHLRLLPTDGRYQQLQDWIAHNQYGWLPYLTTVPGGGVYVSAGTWSLQFFGTTVFACPKSAACSEKSVRESEYEFLER